MEGERLSYLKGVWYRVIDAMTERRSKQEVAHRRGEFDAVSSMLSPRATPALRDKKHGNSYSCRNCRIRKLDA
jgi:hypothetical protein